jgi:hypothetical protein
MAAPAPKVTKPSPCCCESCDALYQVQLSSVQNSGQFVDSGAGKVSAHAFYRQCCRVLRVCDTQQVQERSMAADSERAYEAFVSHQMGGGAPPK